MHEDFKRGDDVSQGSERQFGLVFAAVFAVIGLIPLIDGEAVRWWALVPAIAFAVIAFVYPKVLSPFNRWWFCFGLLLHKVVSPIVLGLMFLLAITPVGLLMRALGKDLLKLRFDRNAESYWIERNPPGPEPESLKNQY
jgi:predicted membrane metal-binding protein